MRIPGKFLSALVAIFAIAAFACSDSPPPSKGGGGGDLPPIGEPPGGNGGGEGGGDGGVGGEGDGGGGGGGTESKVKLLRISPPRGSMSGNDSLLLEGEGFAAGIDGNPDHLTEVLFGSNPGTNLRVVGDDRIFVRTPPNAAGDVDVTIRNPNGEWTCSACYRYLAPVELSRVEPDEGSLFGGNSVTLRGLNLREGMVVTFGKRAAISVTANDDGTLTAVVPPSDDAGAVDVRIFDADGESYLRSAYVYLDELSISRLEPNGGPLAGGNRVNVLGTGFTGSEKVTVGGKPAQSELLGGGVLSVVIPPGTTAGGVDFVIESDTTVVRTRYAYFDDASNAVALYAVTADGGPMEGGQLVTLAGSGLDGADPVVRFDGELATDVTVIDSHFLQVRVPEGVREGAVPVSIRVRSGGDTLEEGYRYERAILATAIIPSQGPIAGGTAFELNGSSFPENVRVYVGALEATNVERVSETLITGVTPAGSEGLMPVRVVDADTGAFSRSTLDFTYVGSFEVHRLTPSIGARAGGTRTMLRGRSFEDGMEVRFGDVEANSVTVLDPFTAVVFSPRGDVGTVDVEIDSGKGAQATLFGAFSYYDPTNSAGGSSGGPLAGTLNVTVLEAGSGKPIKGAQVILGNDSSTPLQGLTDDRGQITLSDPSLIKAQVVTVTAADYESATVVNQVSENLTVLLTYVGPPPPPQCQNGVDDDGDGFVDFDDPHCMCSPENSPMPELCVCPNPMAPPIETNPCCDGEDNDGDGLIDMDDPDCACSQGFSEGPLAACSNCLDDDGDGLIDFESMMPDPGCSHRGDDSEQGAVVTGRVYGFKLPRPLEPNEEEVAFVRLSYSTYYSAPPWGSSADPFSGIQILQDGGSYLFEFTNSRYMAVYAVYGVRNKQTGVFTPLLMGVRRNLNPQVGQTVTADIVLDMHMDMQVPVTLINPVTFNGQPGATRVYAYMHLDREGYIPVGRADATGTSTTFTSLPRLSGDSLVFQAIGTADLEGGGPLSASYRRQDGDLTGGITIGPFMGPTQITSPVLLFDGVISWRHEPGPDPEIVFVEVVEPTMMGDIPVWQLVLPGSETRVALPPSTMQALRAKYPAGVQLNVLVTAGREPRFSYEDWSYDNLDVRNYTSFTMTGVASILLP